MTKITINGYSYNKVDLKCGGHIYVEPFGEGEEEDRCKIYDEHMNYFDYISIDDEEILAHAHYDEMLNYFTNCKDLHNYLGVISCSYTCGDSVDDIIDNICQDHVLYYTEDELEEEKQQMLDFYDQHGEKEFCAEYLINKIGNIYFYMED